MKNRLNLGRQNVIRLGVFLLQLLLFWVILLIKLPASFTRNFHEYSPWMFLIVLVLYYLTFRWSNRFGTLICLGLTMVLFAFTLSYLWTSGFSDNFIIGGLLPYKDGKNYYIGANMILNGVPPINAGQATERPLFPGFLAVMLFLTGHNLKVALAIIVQFAGLTLYMSVRQVRNSFGALAASLYTAFMYFHIQSLLGYSMSETIGFTVGCFGFVMIWLTSHHLKWHDLLLGLVTLLVAVSARAGAFIIFPMLVLWIGWVFRGDKKFSLRMAVYAFGAVLIGYLLVNSVYARLLGIPPGYSFGNFSYALYGQVRGGNGWHSAIKELGTRNPAIVYREAWNFFLAHPISLFIAFAKSYWDFFLLGDHSIFPFSWQDWYWVNLVLWMSTIVLLMLGLIELFRNIHSKSSALFIAGFLGIFLSIPFLPPIDGGARFYTSTMPFLYIILAVGISRFSKDARQIVESDHELQNEIVASRVFSVAALALILVAPLVIFSLGQKPAYTLPACPAQQVPFVAQLHQGSYIDLIKNKSAVCGVTPEVCLQDFDENNSEKKVDDFYQILFKLMSNNQTSARLFPAIDWAQSSAHYFYISHDQLPSAIPPGVITGCAVEIMTQSQSIYQVESISSGAK